MPRSGVLSLAFHDLPIELLSVGPVAANTTSPISKPNPSDFLDQTKYRKDCPFVPYALMTRS